MFEILGEATPEHFIKKNNLLPYDAAVWTQFTSLSLLHLRTSRRSHNASTMNIPFLSKICQHIWHKIIDKKRPRLLVIPTYFLMPYPGKKPTKETGVISPLLRYFKGKFCIMSSLIMTLFSLFCRSVPDSGFLPLFTNISHPKDSAEKITHKPYISCVIPVFLFVITLHHCLFSVNIFRM